MYPDPSGMEHSRTSSWMTVAHDMTCWTLHVVEAPTISLDAWHVRTPTRPVQTFSRTLAAKEASSNAFLPKFAANSCTVCWAPSSRQ